MKKRIILVLFLSHLLVAAIGFTLGIYMLPIITAPPSPEQAVVDLMIKNREFIGQFSPERQDSDLLHWGEGEVSISGNNIIFDGNLAPGPDYRLYLSPVFVETELDFNRHKSSMVQVGEVKTFDNFIVVLPAETDPSKYTSLIVWCETFGQFITSGNYKEIR
jgi:hypothetical protein